MIAAFSPSPLGRGGRGGEGFSVNALRGVMAEAGLEEAAT